MAKIVIKDLEVQTIIGIYPHERKKKQKVFITISYSYDSEKAQKSDNIADTVDYDILKQKILTHVSSSKYFLIERLASMILEIVMQNKTINEATIIVTKPKALKEAQSVSIELHAQRPL